MPINSKDKSKVTYCLNALSRALVELTSGTKTTQVDGFIFLKINPSPFLSAFFRGLPTRGDEALIYEG